MAKPTIRFKGYTDDWEQRKLGDVFKEYSEKNHTELPALTIIQGGGTVKREDSDRNLMYDKSNLSNYKMVRKDDFIVHLRSFEGGLEKASSDGIISPAYHTFHSDVADSRFYYPYFRSHEFIKHKLVPHVYGIRDGRSIDIDGMKTIEIPYTSTEEQQKIGDYLESIDHHITLHQRKCEETKILKKYMLQKMFPQNGQKVPEIRFKGFTDDWEQRKLGDSCKLNGRIGFRGYTEKDIISKEAGGVLTFSPTNIVDNKLTIECKNTYITREKYDESPEIKISNGDILFVKTGSTLGKSALVAGLKEDASINPQIVVMHVEKDTENFMSNVLITDRVMKQVAAVKIGGAVPTMTETELKNFTYFAPAEKEEKKKIGDHFRTLDNLITLHQRITPYFLKINAFVWEQRKLGDVLERRIEQRQQSEEYPRLAFASGQGVIPLSERKTNNREQLTKDEYTKKYLVTELNDIVYNPANVKYGAIDRNKCGRGLISPIYVTFTTNEIPGFIERIVTSHDFQQRALRFEEGTVTKRQSVNPEDLVTLDILVAPKREEQQKIATYFDSLDHLITLHQRKPYFWNKFIVIDWEQRKLLEFVSFFNGLTYTPDDVEETGTLVLRSSNVKNGEIVDADNVYVNDKAVTSENVHEGDIIVVVRNGSRALIGKHAQIKASMPNTVIGAFMSGMRSEHSSFVNALLDTSAFENEIAKNMGATINQITGYMFSKMEFMIPSGDEQQKIGEHFQSLDNLITLHHHKLFIINGLKLFTAIQCKCYLLLNISNKNKKTKKEIKLMPELERVIEEKLIDQLVYGDSQWTYREDLKTEEDLWRNFKYILEQNNKDRLNGESLSDAEFEQVKNQLQFSSFYKAGEWLVGENGKVMVHVQRDTEKLHLVVMNHEHIAGGSSVYEVINQYSALKDEDDYYTVSRNRRFDVTLMINGLPMIHIELKNRQHSYMDGFNQIKKYISEGKFTGIFSAVQMFVVSNGVDTKYFAAASDTDLNAKFMSGWVDEKNNPVSDYLDFAKSVLRIPEAHEMIARYTVLDRDAKRLIILRPYQIHAIESIREASKIGKSGFVWHTTGSGKTLTSYKATRNLLMDIPSLDKTIFLIDRKDLDTQTSSAFQAYANNDVIAVDKTDNVNDLKKKLKSGDRKVIVTTIQKMQILVTKRLQEDTPEYNKIKNLRIAFVVDECHRAVTPKTKRELERFFGRSLWFGFTGTPRFAENPYAQMGDLPRTTEELYGKCLHKYTIQNAIKDNAVLGFQVEHNGPKNMEDETDPSLYDNETHMLRVLDIILNKSYQKFGLQNGKGQTYEAILTTSSIQLAQKYYELLSKVKNGETDLEIDERMKQVLPDYPKFAITYSVTENEEGSHVNQEKMQKSLNDYNEMFGTKFDLSQIQSYNENLNKRLARKDKKYKSRNRQLDLVIVVDRLLTGFDAPCLSTIFIDRQPMGPHDLIQAFSRTNRIFDPNKAYGQIVTFQAPVLFKECVDNAVKLYSAGSTEVALLAEWDKVEPAFKRALSALKAVAETPDEETDMSLKELKVFAKAFQTFDRLFAQIKSFTQYDESMLEDYGITEEEYEDYVGHYQNAMTKIKLAEPDDTQTPPEAEETVDTDYELMAYSSTKIDYEYIINLIQNIVTPDEDTEAVTPEERQKQIDEVKQYIEEMRKDNPKVADIMTTLVNEIEQDENKYKGQSIMNIVENMKHDCINQVVTDFCVTWYASKDDVMYAALHYRNGEIPNESVIKSTIDYTRYKESQEKALPKFKYYSQCMAELRKILDEEIKPLITVS